MPGTTEALPIGALTFTTLVDTFLVARAVGQAGAVTIGGPADPTSKTAGFALDHPVPLLLGLNRSGVPLMHAGPVPIWSEAADFLTTLLPPGAWELEKTDLLAGIHRVTHTGWYPSGFAFGFRITETMAGGVKVVQRRTPKVGSYTLFVEFLAVLQSIQTL